MKRLAVSWVLVLWARLAAAGRAVAPFFLKARPHFLIGRRPRLESRIAARRTSLGDHLEQMRNERIRGFQQRRGLQRGAGRVRQRAEALERAAGVRQNRQGLTASRAGRGRLQGQGRWRQRFGERWENAARGSVAAATKRARRKAPPAGGGSGKATGARLNRAGEIPAVCASCLGGPIWGMVNAA